MSGTNENKDRPVRAAEAKAADHKTKALITPLAGVEGEPEALTRKSVDLQDLTSPY